MFSAITKCQLKILRKSYLDKQNLFELDPKIILLKFSSNYVRKKIEKHTFWPQFGYLIF